MVQQLNESERTTAGALLANTGFFDSTYGHFEADVLARFAQMPGLKLIDLQVECRSTMCRLQLLQPSPNGFGPLNAMLESVAPGLEPRWMTTVKERINAPVVSIAYLWREGFAPPKPELGQPDQAN